MTHPEDFGLTDPKMVGASEYAAIYETLADTLADCEAEDIARDHALAMLDEFIGHARSMKREIEAHE